MKQKKRKIQRKDNNNNKITIGFVCDKGATKTPMNCFEIRSKIARK